MFSKMIRKILKLLENIFQFRFIPNHKTLQAIKNIEARKYLVKAKNVKDLFKKLGI